MVNVSIATSSVGISCRKYVSESLYRHGDLAPYIRQISHFETNAQVTEPAAFSIRHVIWLFSCYHQTADAIRIIESFRRRRRSTSLISKER
jgi:hypothetical protein